MAFFVCRTSRASKKSGHQMAEFSAALVLLVIGIVIPVLDLGVVPLRWLLWQEVLNIDSHKLARSENFSTAQNAIAADPSLAMYGTRIDGTKLLNSTCSLIMTMINPPYEYSIVDDPQSIPEEWLPGGPRSPCYYEVEISATIEISPLILLSGIKAPIPGLTKPLTCLTKARAHWENYGRDPITNLFFMQE